MTEVRRQFEDVMKNFTPLHHPDGIDGDEVHISIHPEDKLIFERAFNCPIEWTEVHTETGYYLRGVVRR